LFAAYGVLATRSQSLLWDRGGTGGPECLLSSGGDSVESEGSG